MLYVSQYDKARNQYGVTDTDDNTTEWVSSAELFGIVKDMHIKVAGVSLTQMKIGVVNADGTPVKKPVAKKASTSTAEPAVRAATTAKAGAKTAKAGAKTATKAGAKTGTKAGAKTTTKKPSAKTVKKAPEQTRLQYLDEQIGFDYVVEQSDGRDFTQFVVSTGGDVSTYRVYGNPGDYTITAK